MVTIAGKVSEYLWENPHAHVLIKVAPGAEDASVVGIWDFEGARVNIMARQGWPSRSGWS